MTQLGLAAQTSCESRVERAIQSGDRELAVDRSELASLLMKKDQSLVVRARLKNVFRDDEYGR